MQREILSFEIQGLFLVFWIWTDEFTLHAGAGILSRYCLTFHATQGRTSAVKKLCRDSSSQGAGEHPGQSGLTAAIAFKAVGRGFQTL